MLSITEREVTLAQALDVLGRTFRGFFDLTYKDKAMHCTVHELVPFLDPFGTDMVEVWYSPRLVPEEPELYTLMLKGRMYNAGDLYCLSLSVEDILSQRPLQHNQLTLH